MVASGLLGWCSSVPGEVLPSRGGGWGSRSGYHQDLGLLTGCGLLLRRSRRSRAGPSRASQHFATWGCFSGHVLSAGKWRARLSQHSPSRGMEEASGGPHGCPGPRLPLRLSPRLMLLCLRKCQLAAGPHIIWSNPAALEMAKCSLMGLELSRRHAEDAEDRPPACWVLVGSQDQDLGQDERNAAGGFPQACHLRAAW